MGGGYAQAMGGGGIPSASPSVYVPDLFSGGTSLCVFA